MSSRMQANWWLIRQCRDVRTLSYMKGRWKPRNTSQPLALRFRFADFPVLVRPGESDVKVVWSLFCQHEYRSIRAWNYRTILDCGANVGVFLLYAMTNGRPEKYIAVEPDPDTFAMLQQQVASVGAGDFCSVIQGAVMGHDGTVHFDRGGESWGHKVTEKGALVLPAYSIPTLLDRAGLKEVDLLKIDIEGAESSVIPTIREWGNRVKHIVIELHGSGCDYRWFKEQVEPAGFTAFPSGELFQDLPGAARIGASL
jgi:FkbM family methyltransferase